MHARFFRSRSLLAGLFLIAAAVHGAHPSRGLWVGEVALDEVNEATGAVGDSNTYEFTDPELTTPTADTAYLRLILHVNGAGQVNLLKSVAIVEGNAATSGNDDLLLITDPSLYPNFAGIAKRVASAHYDFGDARAVLAVDGLIDAAVDAAVDAVLNTEDPDADSVLTASQDAVGEVLGQADADAHYLDRGTGASSFLTDDFFELAEVETIADAVAAEIDDGSKTAADFTYEAGSDSYAPFESDPLGGGFGAVFDAAVDLRDDSFYGDRRGILAVVRIVESTAAAVEAVPDGADLAEKEASARLAAEAAWHNAADVEQAYNRFLADPVYENLPGVLLPTAVQAATDAEGRDEDESEILASVEDALLLETELQSAFTEAELVRSESFWGDPRARLAVERLVEAAATTAASVVLDEPDALAEEVEEALAVAVERVEPAPVFFDAPSESYTEYVSGSEYGEAGTDAAETAAEEAFFQFGAGVDDEAALRQLTRRAVSAALVDSRNEVASIPSNEAPLDGRLEVGGELQGTLHLAALAPTNPFLHRLHPDHPEGFPIRREIRITVAETESGEAFDRVGYGVSRLSGTYEEEIFGLHKPLGNNQDIGLKTRGDFTLNRLSLVDSLNY